ncbi:hypothetical protein GDO81_020653 [Engystomops pustulosus]|uniref:Uncharacterized protein n=1 Tax=Engystomops pustulosus TaxID=76066 RepID=A0AAV6Z7Q7_ENGPU|nr:hypothetical protein GDO81_020653 [Engystomops pustulosus]
MAMVRSSVAAATCLLYGITSVVRPRPTVWLLGHSYIFWADQREEMLEEMIFVPSGWRSC